MRKGKHSSHSEYEEYYESEEEEEEYEEEESIPSKKPNKKKRHPPFNKDEEEGDSGDDDDSEKQKLTQNMKAIERMSEISSRKKIQITKNLTTNSGGTVYGGRNKMTKKEKIIKMFKSKWFSLFMLIITGWSMLSDDIRNLGPKALDPLFYTLIILCILIFCFDIKFTDGYIPSTYFFIDLLVTLSLFFFDIGWLWHAMLGLGSIEFSNAETAYNTAMKGESLRDGTRIARISRIIRLIRLIRLFKMYRHAHAFISYVQDPKYNTAEDTLKKKLKGDQEESQIGQKISDLTIRRVLVLVILMLLWVPLFTINTYKEENAYFEYGLDLVESKTENMMSPVYIDLFESYIAEHKDIPMPAINVYIHGNSSIPKANRIYDKEGTDLDSFRPYELELVKTDKGGAVAVFDFTYTVRLTAGLSLARSIFVWCVLTLGAFFFSRDATFLIVKPIEGMISKVNRIAKNPLEAAVEEENEALAYERAMMMQKKMNKKVRKIKTDDEYETVKIEQTIIKIGALLAIGFGEAGAKIIADSIGNEGDNANSKVVAIFGFCDIRNFTDATEVLQEDVMLFVNEVADIVHGVVDRYSGAANKNIGDAFLLVWKFNPEDVEVNEDGELVTKRNGRNAQYADMSVMSFLKIIAEIRKSHKLERYSHNQQILEKLPNFQVKLGFGLHVGWAIEGAIGSDFKIDASYLSPNVNTASRLEAATKQFGVPLLISGEMRKICTPRTQANMRIIDIVTVKGSNEPTEMVTCDVEQSLIKVEVPKRQRNKRQDKKMKKVRGRIERNRYKQAAMSNQIQVSEKFELDEDIKIMRSPYSKEFFETFKKGFEHYIGGDWQKSAEYLNSIEGRLIAEDFPTMQILSYMKSLDFKAPRDWNGYRVLTEK